jgi:hypothetical protein
MALTWKRWLAGWKLRPALSRLHHSHPWLEELEDRTVLSTLIPVTNHRDLVFDPTRGLLDITTTSGAVQQYNVTTGMLTGTGLNVGTSLLGADITADGSALYVAEGQTSSGQGVLHRVDLTTGVVTNLSYNLAFSESGSFDVALGANGKGLFDGSFAGSGWVPLRQVDLTTGALSTRTDDPGSGGSGQVRQNTSIQHGADRSLFVFTESNISSGPLFTYNAATDTFSHSVSTNVFLDNAMPAVNRNGSLIALEENGGVTIMDANLNFIRSIPYVTGGMTFDPVHDVLYAVNPSLGQIQAYDTNTWAMKYQMAVGESVSTAQAMGNGVMTTSADGSLLFLATPTGVRMYNLPAASGNQLVVTGFPTSDTAGAAGSFTVTAEDVNGNVLTNYTGTVHFSSTDATAQLPADYTFTAADAGTHTFSATLVKAGVQSITATDTASGAGTEGNIVVSPGAATSIVFTSGVQGSYTAGGPVNVNIMAEDSYGNAATGYRGTVHFTSTDPQASLPADYTFTAADGGKHSLTAFLKTAGTQSITATDNGTPALTVTQSGLNVVAASTRTYTLTYPSATTAGVAQTFTVTSRDLYGNRTTLYSGTVHLSSTDGSAVLPANYTFTSSDQGQHTFTATLRRAGTQSITVADTGPAAINGTETGIVVSPAATSRLSVALSPDASTAGQALSLFVTAVDPYGNLTPGYTGTVHFTSTDAQASLPADYSFTAADNGQHVFTNGVTLYTVQPPGANAQFVTATDTVTSSITGTGHDFVRAAAMAGYQLSVPAAVAAGSPFSVTVTAVDPSGNRATSYTGTVHFTSSDGAGALPADYTFTSSEAGVHTFTSGVTFTTLGSQTLTATDAANSAFTASATTTVNPEVQGLHFVVRPSVSSTTAGSPFSVTVTALDGDGNVATGYTGTVTVASSDSGSRLALPAPYTFTPADAGVHTFSNGVILVTAGTQTLTAYDRGITDGSSAGNASVQVSPSFASTMTMTGFPSPVTAGTPGSLTVTVLDGYGNVATGYTGTVHFTSSDAAALLPANYTFTAADAGVHPFTATLNTAATQSIRATDTSAAWIYGTQTGIVVVPGQAARLAFTLQGPLTAGVAATFMVTALDASGNEATGYRGTIHFTSSDGQASLPADYTFTAADNGQHAFSASLVLKTAGTQTVTATDTTTSSITGTTTQTVVPGPVVLVSASVPGGYATTTAGQAFSITAKAEDAYGNVVPSFTGTVFWSTSDHQATLPGAYTFTSADQGVHTFTNGAALYTAGWQSVTASWQSGQNSSTSIVFDNVQAAAASRVQVGAPSSATAGTAFSVTVTALDPYGNVASNFQGTAHFSSSDATASLPADYTFTSGDGGTHTFTNAATLDTAGWQTVSVSAGGFVNSAWVSVNAAAASHFRVTAPATGTAGSAFSVTLTALDPFNNVVTGYRGTVHFTSSDARATLPANYTFTAADNGQHAFSNAAILVTAGNQTVGATDTGNGSVSGSATVAVSPTSAAGFVLAAPPTATAGGPFSVTVTAVDPYGNTVPGYAGTVHFASGDAGASLPADYTFGAGDNGTHTFGSGVTLVTAGSQSLTVSASGLSSAGATVAVSAAAAASVSLAAPATTTAGTAFSVTVTARDAYGNVASGYAGTVHFTGSDPLGALPADYTFTATDAGAHTFGGVTLDTAGNQTVGVADTSAPGLTSSATVSVSAAAATHFYVSVPSAATAGKALDATVSALDTFNNVAGGYAGTVHFSSSDGSATLPADYTFTAGDGGTHTFAAGVTLDRAGTQTVGAADGSLSGSASVVVAAAQASSFVLSAPANATAGTAISLTVTAQDRFGNVATAYAGTAHFSSSDGQASLPADPTLSGGSGTLSATLKTAGSQSLTATDGSVTGSTTVAVAAANATHFRVSAPGSATAGAPLSVTVTALDAYGNTAAAYAGTVHFASSDAQAALPADTTLSGGSGTLSATLKTAGSQSLTATDTASGSITGSQAGIVVSAATASTLIVGGFPSPTAAGAAHTLTVTAKDAYGNVATGYTGTVHLSSSDGQAVLPVDYLFSASDAGTHSFNVTLETAGTQSLTARDTSTASLTGSETGITVNPTAVATLAVSGYPSATTAGVAGTLTVTLRDANGNIAAGYRGTVHFSSSDVQAGLPADYTFTAADAGVHSFFVTLKTAGPQSITVRDTAAPALTATQSGIAVSAAAATHFVVSGYPTSTNAGIAHTVTVTALDAYGNVATGYTGTVRLTSSDAQAVLPSNYTFTAADAGVHSFTVTLVTAGSQSITATDTTTGTITGSESGIAVTASSATHFSIQMPASATQGVPFTITIVALDAYGNVDTNYRGTIHFTSSDRKATLPADYTFTAADAGTHPFTVTLRATNSQTITATDKKTSTINGTGSTNVSR